MISRRSFLGCLGLSLGAAAVPSALRAAGEPEKQPNIIFFLVDDMGWQDTSLAFWYKNGKAVRTRLNARYRTPNMEAMAKGGMLFTDAYACSVCSPTRCSLMSGMNAARHRVTDWTLGVNDNSRLSRNGEELVAPRWAANGLQPEGTQPTGTCNAPWRYDAGSNTYAPGGNVDYNMKMPYTNALAFPKVLQEAGYYTVHCGKAHWGSGSNDPMTGKGPSTPGANPLYLGFDVNIAGCEVGGPYSYRNDKKFGNFDPDMTFAAKRQFATHGLAEYYGKTFADLEYKTDRIPGDRPVYLTDALTDKALKTLKAHLDGGSGKPGKPFYLYMSHYAIHSPWTNERTWDEARSSDLSPANDTACPNPNDGLNWDEQERNYTNLISAMDDSLGVIRKFLRDNKIEDNTLLVFMADNGGHTIGRMNEHGNAPLRAGKGSCYEGGTRECCIAEWPGKIASGAVCSEPIIIEDFYPTLLEAAGVAVPGPDALATTPAGVFSDGALKQVLDGESVLPVMLGTRKTVHEDGSERPLLWHAPNCWTNVTAANLYPYNFYTALRLGKWKLVYQHGKAPEASFELYNLEKDIGESVNLVRAYPQKTDELRKLMTTLLKERHAQMPTQNGKPIPYPDDASLKVVCKGVTFTDPRVRK